MQKHHSEQYNCVIEYIDSCSLNSGCAFLNNRTPTTKKWKDIWGQGFPKLTKVKVRNIRDTILETPTSKFKPMAQMLR